MFYPDLAGTGFPTLVEVNIFYYQESKDVKVLA